MNGTRNPSWLKVAQPEGYGPFAVKVGHNAGASTVLLSVHCWPFPGVVLLVFGSLVGFERSAHWPGGIAGAIVSPGTPGTVTGKPSSGVLFPPCEAAGGAT